jgi:hypothetical protein
MCETAMVLHIPNYLEYVLNVLQYVEPLKVFGEFIILQDMGVLVT